jgi:hypothetical protein
LIAGSLGDETEESEKDRGGNLLGLVQPAMTLMRSGRRGMDRDEASALEPFPPTFGLAQLAKWVASRGIISAIVFGEKESMPLTLAASFVFRQAKRASKWAA